ncbi:MAG: hypothetical protein ACJA13_002523, partial [Paraglaciecola sp.]
RWLSQSSIKRINKKAPSKVGNTEIGDGQVVKRSLVFDESASLSPSICRFPHRFLIAMTGKLCLKA